MRQLPAPPAPSQLAPQCPALDRSQPLPRLGIGRRTKRRWRALTRWHDDSPPASVSEYAVSPATSRTVQPPSATANHGLTARAIAPMPAMTSKRASSRTSRRRSPYRPDSHRGCGDQPDHDTDRAPDRVVHDEPIGGTCWLILAVVAVRVLGGDRRQLHHPPHHRRQPPRQGKSLGAPRQQEQPIRPMPHDAAA